ncbi:energy transducer TonB [Pseudodesulfovibrio sp. S3]|nr:energy transducer TonB [Pseudodesulfovibrio sp. S3]
MVARARGGGEFVASCMVAACMVGLVYVGILLLNDAPVPKGMEIVEGAIRLAQPQRDKPLPELQRRKLDEMKPPKELPKQFSNKVKSKPVKPVMTMSTPRFSADTHPGLAGDISLPSGDFGGIGFTMDEVDDIPQVLRSVPPDYPYVAKRNRVEGEVVVRMLVTAKGTPQDITIHSSTPAGVFDDAALNAAKRWRFQPGKYKGEAVDTWVLLPFVFELTQ